MADEERPIIVKRIKKGHGGHHGGAWKVAYADFVTAMMALFMVLWIMSQGPEVRQAIASYFNDPKGMPITQTSRSLLDSTGSGIMDNISSRATPGDGRGAGQRFAKPLEQAAQEKERLKAAGQKIIKQILARPDLSALSKMVQVVLTPEGLRIELIDQVDGTFFDVGSARPKEVLTAVVSEIVTALQPLVNQLAIEGHTDARQYSGGASYSNWELSADRGNAVRRMMLGAGFPLERVAEVRAYADKNPLPGSDPLDGRNRRISILVKSDYAGVLVDGSAPEEPPTVEGAPPTAPAADAAGPREATPSPLAAAIPSPATTPAPSHP